MVERRRLLTGGVMAGVAALAADGADAAGQQREDDTRVADAVNTLRTVVDRAVQVSPELARIREQQRTFLKANQKFPDFIEVGIGVWESVYDWHVRHQQPINVARLADGRYAMSVALSTLILRPDQGENYVGFGFDVR